MFARITDLPVQTRNVHRVSKRLSTGRAAQYFYHRHTRVRLPGRPGSPEFMHAYFAAEQKWAAQAQLQGSLPKPRTSARCGGRQRETEDKSK